MAPQTCAAFAARLPFESKIVHVRWRGCVDTARRLRFRRRIREPYELPAPGQFLLYPGGISETEILLAYGGVHFASKMGQLAGNHFITLTSGLDKLPEIGRLALWKARKPIKFSAA